MNELLTEHEMKVLLDAQAVCYRLSDKYGVHIGHQVASGITTLLDFVERQKPYVQPEEKPW